MASMGMVKLMSWKKFCTTLSIRSFEPDINVGILVVIPKILSVEMSTWEKSLEKIGTTTEDVTFKNSCFSFIIWSTSPIKDSRKALYSWLSGSPSSFRQRVLFSSNASWILDIGFWGICIWTNLRMHEFFELFFYQLPVGLWAFKSVFIQKIKKRL